MSAPQFNVVFAGIHFDALTFFKTILPATSLNWGTWANAPIVLSPVFNLEQTLNN